MKKTRMSGGRACGEGVMGLEASISAWMTEEWNIVD